MAADHENVSASAAASAQLAPSAPASRSAATPPKASPRADIESFMVMDVMDAAARLEAAGISVVHMEVGQPGTPAPEVARLAAASALESDPLGYTLAAGRPSLRQAIARHYADRHGLDIDPARIVVTTGSSAGFVLTFLALFDTGARLALPVPGYPCYRQILKALGQREVPIRTGPHNRWMPALDDIAAAHRDHAVAGLLVASPANPTGTMLPPGRLSELTRYCDDNGLWFVSDEIYHGLTYGMSEETALAHGRNVVVINSFSKYFSMTGWRIGWLVVPPDLVRTFERLQQNLYISPPTISQVAAEAALGATMELEANRRVYAENRRILLDGLPRAGFDRIIPADGAFYLYCDVSQWCDDSLALAARILEEAHVAVTSGADFDKTEGRRYIRFSYARATADIVEGLARLERWAASNR